VLIVSTVEEAELLMTIGGGGAHRVVGLVRHIYARTSRAKHRATGRARERRARSPIGVAGVLVASDDLVEALAEKREGGVSYPLILARIVQSLDYIASESVVMIKSAQGQ
jgi:hypothetical protein